MRLLAVLFGLIGPPSAAWAEVELVLLAPGPALPELEAALSTGQNADTLAADLLDACLALGYGDAAVELVPSGAGWRAEIDPGPPWQLGEIRFVGSQRFRAEDLVQRLDARPGQRFDARALGRDLERLLAGWGRAGHLFARFRLQPRRAAGERVDLVVFVDEGPVVILGEVRARGNETTAPAVLQRAAGLRPGQPIDMRDIEEAGDRLRRLGYFAEVRGPVLVRAAAPDTLDAEFVVVETPTHSISGVLGYVPAGEGQKSRLTGFLELALHNIFGSGRELDLSWARMNSEEFTLDVQWHEPWVFGTSASAQLFFQQVVQDSTYLEDAFGGNISYPIARGTEGSLRFARTRVIPGRRGDGLSPAESRTRSVGVGLRRDGRDHRWNPRRGTLVKSTLDAGRRDASTLLRATTQAALHLPGWGRQSWALGTRLWALEPGPGEIQLPDLFRVGGVGSLRGYRQDELRVLRGGLVSIEMRLHTAATSRVGIFVDAAHLNRAEAAEVGTEFVWKTLLGYGFGVRIGSRAGLVAIDYGIAAGDSPATGKLHVGIQSIF